MVIWSEDSDLQILLVMDLLTISVLSSKWFTLTDMQDSFWPAPLAKQLQLYLMFTVDGENTPGPDNQPRSLLHGTPP